jgi:hypothetical protein
MLLDAYEAAHAGSFTRGTPIAIASLAGRTEMLAAFIARIASNRHGVATAV